MTDVELSFAEIPERNCVLIYQSKTLQLFSLF